MRENLAPENIDVIVLCGGKGERLRPVVVDKPKSLADVDGRPFLDLIIDHAASFGFRRFVLCTGYLGEQIERNYLEKTNRPRVIISREENPLGTGGAIKNAGGLIDSNPFLVMNGDSFCPVDLKDFVSDYFLNENRFKILLDQTESREDVGSVTLGSRFEVTNFREKVPHEESQYINAGIYLFDRSIFDFFPNQQQFSLEQDVFPKLVGQGLFGYPTLEHCYDIGTPQRYAQFLQNRVKIDQ